MIFEALSSKVLVFGSLGFLFLFVTSVFCFIYCVKKKEFPMIIKFADVLGGLFVFAMFLWFLLSVLVYSFTNNSSDGFYSSICFEAPIVNAFYLIWPVLIIGGIIGYFVFLRNQRRRRRGGRKRFIFSFL